MKKNQLALIFLTLITMLAVWYFKAPGSTKEEEPTINVSTTMKNESLENMREVIRKERSETITTLNNILADENATLAAKTEATLQIKALSSLSEQEVLLETKVTNLGYSDAFVHSTSSGVEVIVITLESSSEAALEIINLVNSTFTTNENVVVNFVTAEQLQKA